jgi:hypothetical protein
MSEGQVGGPGQAPLSPHKTTLERSLRCHTRAGLIDVSPLSTMDVIVLRNGSQNRGGFCVEEKWVMCGNEWRVASEIRPGNHTDRLNVSACYVRSRTLHFHSHSFPLFYFILLLRTKTMQMEGWADYLHTSLNGEHALFPALRLTNFGSFVTAAVLSASICLAERCVWSGGLVLCPQGTNKAWLFDVYHSPAP